MEDSGSAVKKSIGDRFIGFIGVLFAVIAVLCGAGIFAFAIHVVTAQYTLWQQTLHDHFAAIIGLPGAAVTAFVLVVFLRQTDGPIEFQGLGFTFKGASGQVAMWVICFLAIAGAIKLCW